VDDREVFPFRRRNFDARWNFGQGLRGEKRERQVRDGRAEIGAAGAVPGINFVEGF